MDKQTIIEAMARQDILSTDLSRGPGAVILRSGGRPKCIVIHADGNDFYADIPGFFSKTKLKIRRIEVEAQAERDRKMEEFLQSQKAEETKD